MARKSRALGVRPQNSLGSKSSSGRSTPDKKKPFYKPNVPSDETLALGPRPRTREYTPSRNTRASSRAIEESRWKPKDPNKKVLLEKRSSTHLVDDTEEEHEKAQVVVSITDVGRKSKLEDDWVIEVAIISAIGGKSLIHLLSDRGDLRLKFTADLQFFTLEKAGQPKLGFFGSSSQAAIKSILYSHDKVHFDFLSQQRLNDKNVNSLQVETTENNMNKLIPLLSSLMERYSITEYELAKASSEELDKMITKKYEKEFRSLTTKRLSGLKGTPSRRTYSRGSSIRTPASANSSANATHGGSSSKSRSPDYSNSSNKGSIKKFYSPVTPSDFAAGVTTTNHFTRNSARLSGEKVEHITISDTPTIKKASKPKPPPKPFKPALKYTFNDKTQFKIKDADFKCLARGKWINDTLIDFFIKFFTEEKVKVGDLKDEDYNVLSTFFFTKLVSSPYHYDNIKRWIFKSDLLKKKFVILPINESLHWYGSIIYNLNGLLTHDGVCTVYVFDSLSQKHDDILTPMQDFLVDYAKDVYKIRVSPERIKLLNCKVPRQPNFNDCGIHVLYNVYRFLSKTNECLEFWNSENARRGQLNSLFAFKERDEYRKRLKTALLTLQQEQIARGDTPDDEDDKNSALGADANKNKGSVEGDEDDDDEILLLDAAEFHGLRDISSKEASMDPESGDGSRKLETPIFDESSDENGTPMVPDDYESTTASPRAPTMSPATPERNSSFEDPGNEVPGSFGDLGKTSLIDHIFDDAEGEHTNENAVSQELVDSSQLHANGVVSQLECSQDTQMDKDDQAVSERQDNESLQQETVNTETQQDSESGNNSLHIFDDVKYDENDSKDGVINLENGNFDDHDEEMVDADTKSAELINGQFDEQDVLENEAHLMNASPELFSFDLPSSRQDEKSENLIEVIESNKDEKKTDSFEIDEIDTKETIDVSDEEETKKKLGPGYKRTTSKYFGDRSKENHFDLTSPTKKRKIDVVEDNE